MAADGIKDNINKHKCVVIIPAYKKAFSDDERKCTLKYVSVFKERDIYFVLPKGLDNSWYKENFPSINYMTFEDKYFKGIKGYNKLMLDISFYKAFSAYEYMLIAQPDAVTFLETDELDRFIDTGFDYFGAPWIPGRRIWEWVRVRRDIPTKGKIICCKKDENKIQMGNGGFSLRNINKTIALINEHGWRKIYWFYKRNEDIFFGVFGRDNNSGFKLADVETGRRFALEYDIKKNVEEGFIPFGVHGWSKEFADFDEMENYLKAHEIWRL